MKWWTCVVLFCVTAVLADEDWLDVTIAQGPVRGHKHPNGDLYAFYNIPYATAPVGESRFKAPQPAPTWSEPFEATGTKSIVCPQHRVMIDLIPDVEVKDDCLVANVLVPNTTERNLSVLVYVHGGGFIMGFGNYYQGTEFMNEKKDFIMVTFNYRLSIHGFLCLGTEDVPGNAGMKDMVALLRWVQQNIASFGGNPDDVTLVGSSAGSASVELLMLSKSADGLFHRVVPESGANLAAFTIQRDPLEVAKTFAKDQNVANVDDIEALEQFYKTASMDLLTSDGFDSRTDSTFLFSPCVERDTDGAFLTESPLTIFKNGNYKKLPLLYGFANMEGLLRIGFFEIWKNKMNEKFSDFLPADLKFDSDEEREEVANQIKKFYFGDIPVGYDNILKYVDFFSDVIITFPMLRAAKLHVEAGHTQVYLYKYSFVSENDPVVPHTDVRGADHCAQSLAWLDDTLLLNATVTPEFLKMRVTVRQIWHNFMKTGKPVPEGSSLLPWPATQANRSPHMVLDEELTLGGVLLEDRVRFWEEIYQKHYRDAIPPRSGADWLDVTIAQGPVRGHKHPNADLYAFYNIPYATAPVGESKFKAPQPAPTWSEPFEATGTKSIVCPQHGLVIDLIPDVEVKDDCLVANVFVPNTTERNLSVLVYVHGGGFITGFGNLYKGTEFMNEKKDFIMVTFNYRLSIHGFLCLGTEDVPGNAGMKDMVALLHWVQQNIASFGGNPDDVTLVGSSGGSAAVDLLMLSKSTDGLFHRVVPESGANLAAFTIQRDPLEVAKTFAKDQNVANVDDIDALEQFYKTASMDLLTSDGFDSRTDSTYLFSPCVERDTDGAFLTESPLTILKNGNYKKLPLLYGFANMEGLLRIRLFEIWKNKMNEKFSDFLPTDLKFDSDEEREEVANKIKKFYFGDIPVSYDNILKYVDFFSDVIFTFPMLRAAKLHVEAGHNQVYLYKYTFVSEYDPVVPHTDVRGADHCAQSFAWLDDVLLLNMTMTETPEFLKMRATVRQLWHNFMKTGKPVPEGSSLLPWPATQANRSPHMVLDEELTLGGVLLEDRVRFWEEIYQKHYRDAIPPRSGADWLDVTIAQGPVRGLKHPNGDLYAFYNIPYATAPVGESKFKAPQPAPTWSEPFEATGTKSIVCPQHRLVIDLIPDVEVKDDCLVANVFVPNTTERNLSVLVYVHGGGFITGFGNLYKGTEFMNEKKDFIMVTFNYRLSIHGFLCLGTEDVPGNAGMKDMVALLHWVQQNIASFGGNPDDVTLVGSSAGSASVELLMLSKSADGLFHRVVPESGANLAAFTIQRDPLEVAKTFAKDQNVANVDDIDALEQFYKTASMDLLTSDGFDSRTDSTYLFSPCVERDTDGAFLTESPLTILKNGNYKKLPLLYGFANMEGLLRIRLFEIWKNKMNEKFSDFLPTDLKFDSDEEREEVANKIKKFYFGDIPVSYDNILKYVDFFSDVIITFPMLRAAKLHVEAGHNQVYLYKYTFVSEYDPVVPHTDVRGADHCAQSFAWLDDMPLLNMTETPEFLKMRATVRQLWHNFMKTGKPVPEGSSLLPWPATQANRSPHMVLDEELTLGGVLLEDRVRFWEEIYQKHYRDAIPPRSGAGNMAPKNIFNLFMLYVPFYLAKNVMIE